MAKCDIVQNFFMAETNAVRQKVAGWDEDLKLIEHADFFMRAKEAGLVVAHTPDVLVIGTHAWDALDAQEQQIVQEAAEISAVKQRVFWAAASAEALVAIRAAGVEIVTPEKRAFAERVEPMLAEIESDPEVGPWLRRIRAWQPAPGAESSGAQPK